MPTLAKPTNAEKEALWDAYRHRRPTRVPVTLATNTRIILLDPKLNTDNYTFEQIAHDAEAHVQVQLQHALYRRTVLNHLTDLPTGLPETWQIGLGVQNVYEAAILGAPVEYREGQVPDTEPFLTDDNKEQIFDLDLDGLFEADFIQHYLQLWQEMEKVCQDLIFEGRPVELQPWALLGTDGPVTVACNVRGTAFLLDMAMEPAYADRLMKVLVQAAIKRRDAFIAYWGGKVQPSPGLADDSVALVSPTMYRERVLPHHRTWYDSCPDGPRGIHLCGDATRHFPTIQEELQVQSFDTGFPVDHGELRRALGPDTELLGGPQVALLRSGTADQVYERAREILQSGVMEGGRFILREGNNLPPQCPLTNLSAMYDACLKYGRYPNHPAG